jgi:hypothetical protein
LIPRWKTLALLNLVFAAFVSSGLAEDLSPISQRFNGRVVASDGSGVDNVGIYRIDNAAAPQPPTHLTTSHSGGYFWIDNAADNRPLILEFRQQCDLLDDQTPQPADRPRSYGRSLWSWSPEQPAHVINFPIIETIVLLHDNDQHFDFNFADQFQARVEAYRAEFENVFLLNAGDVFVRRPDRWEKDGQQFHNDEQWYRQQAFRLIDIMNRIGYDAMTLGNHELATVGRHTRDALETAAFPLLASNVAMSTDRLPPLQRQVFLRTTTGRKIGLFGLTLGATEGVEILDRNQVTTNFRQLKEQCDIVVALNHIGYVADKAIAQKFDFIDVIIGAHSHTLISEAEMVGTVLVAQAGGCPHTASSSHPKYLGTVVLRLEDGQLIEKSGQVVEITAKEMSAIPSGSDG